MEDYESILLVKPEVFVYKIPPRTSNRAVRAADWNLTVPDWTGRLRLVYKGKDCVLKLEDKTSGELFAKCPIDKYPGIALEAVADSSRYFVLRIQDDNGRSAFIGMGFADRGDSFDLNVALQDHFKWLEKTEEIEQEQKSGATAGKPQLDLSFKEGQTITINIGQKKGGVSRPKARATGTGILPPPPSTGGGGGGGVGIGSVKLAPPPGTKSSPSVPLPALASSSPQRVDPAAAVVVVNNCCGADSTSKSHSSTNGSNVDLLLDLGGSGVENQASGGSAVAAAAAAGPPSAPPPPQGKVVDFWGDFENA